MSDLLAITFTTETVEWEFRITGEVWIKFALFRLKFCRVKHNDGMCKVVVGLKIGNFSKSPCYFFLDLRIGVTGIWILKITSWIFYPRLSKLILVDKIMRKNILGSFSRNVFSRHSMSLIRTSLQNKNLTEWQWRLGTRKILPIHSTLTVYT